MGWNERGELIRDDAPRREPTEHEKQWTEKSRAILRSKGEKLLQFHASIRKEKE
jgi:hypothetical protein